MKRLLFFTLLTYTIIQPQVSTSDTGSKTLTTDGKFDQAAAITDSNPYLSQLIAQAKQHNLAEHPVWRALLHYKPKRFGGDESQVDGHDFFLSEEGKTSPQAELNATLAAFFSEQRLEPNNLVAQCRFPARYHWLKRRLHFDSRRLPERRCETFEFFAETLQPTGMTVVFPAEHPNSPSSMFGHTLIRLDRAGQTEATRMLDYTINYAAEAGNVGGTSYALKGLSGGFPGRFRVIPYHMKLREYAQMENRDIWEYRINVNQETLDFIVKHSWELLPTYFDYYFFTENCAYHLLSLIEPGMPQQDLTDDFGHWVLPVDTLRLLQQRNLVKEIRYHPSHYRIIQARRKRLSTDHQALALAIANQDVSLDSPSLTGLPSARQAAVLDLAYDYLRYENIAKVDVMDATLNSDERRLLLARSRLGVVSEQPGVIRPAAEPAQGHLSTRAGLGFGEAGGSRYWLLDWRAAYHDWLDPAAGHAANFALEFASVRVRYHPDAAGDALKLDHFSLVRIENLEPRDDFFKRISWRVTTGVKDLVRREDDEVLAFFVSGGAGVSYRIFDQRVLVYALLEGDLNISRRFDHHIRLAAGPASGAIVSITPAWKAMLAARYTAALTNDDVAFGEVSLGQSWQLGSPYSLRMELNRQRHLDGWQNEAQATLHVYF